MNQALQTTSESQTQPHNNVFLATPDSPVDQFIQFLGRKRYLIFIAITALYLLGFSTVWIPGPDSAQHLIYAKHIINNTIHPYAHSVTDPLSPALAYIIAANHYIFGPDHYLTTTLITMLAITSLTLTIAYRFFLTCSNRGTATLLLLMLASCETFYRYAFQILADLPFLLGMVITLHASQRYQLKIKNQYLNLAYLALGLITMIAFRSVALVAASAIFLTLIAYLINQKRYKTLIFAGLGSFIAIMSLRFIAAGTAAFGLLPDEQILFDRLTNGLPNTLSNLFYVNLPRILTETTTEAFFAFDLDPTSSFIACLPLVVYSLLLFRVNKLWGFMITMFATLWLLFLVVDRYYLAILPLLMIAWYLPVTWIDRNRSAKLGKLALIGALCIFLIPNLIYDGRFIAQRHTANFIHEYKGGRFEPVYELADWLKTNTPPNAIIVTSRDTSLIISYLSDRTTYHKFRPHKSTSHYYLAGPISDKVYRQISKENAIISDVIYTTKSSKDVYEVRKIILSIAP
ncbi:hypothetical protein JD969_01850 [Planctomycetota bacterium]|nr:hypothetical protein JD969_01850 [Planctomycetota bacterium]